MTNFINSELSNSDIINKETLQYITTLIVSLYACFCMYKFYVFNKDIKWINYLFGVVLIYLIIHLYFVTKIEFGIHHVIFICVISWYFLCSEIGPSIKNELLVLSLAEISNIFLSVRNLIRHPAIIKFVSIPAFIQPLNDVLFAITFFFTRIYLYYKYIICNNELLDNITKYNKYFMCDKIVIMIFFGLFFLNIYWFGLICGGLVKIIGLDKIIRDRLLTYNPDPMDPFLLQIESIHLRTFQVRGNC